MNCEYCKHASIFKALSDATRLEICKIISDQAEIEFCAGDILKKLDISQSTLSYHLKLLCDAELIEGRKDKCWMRYKINNENIEELQEYLSSLYQKE